MRKIIVVENKDYRKEKTSCDNNGINIPDYFADVSKMIKLGKEGIRKVEDYRLTRYACYLVVENGDPREEQIAFASGYFEVQTRKQELNRGKDILYRKPKWNHFFNGL